MFLISNIFDSFGDIFDKVSLFMPIIQESLESVPETFADALYWLFPTGFFSVMLTLLAVTSAAALIRWIWSG